MTWISTSCLLALGIFFGSSVLPKLRQPYRFTAALVGYGLSRRMSEALAPVAIGAEAAAAILLLVPLWPRLAGGMALGLLGLYSGFVTYALTQGRTKTSCGCFAFGTDRTISVSLLVRNGAAALLTIPPIAWGGIAAGWISWTFAALAAALLTTVLALVDELGAFYDLIHP
jgi:uncharacterized membrane protein YphA (DoxX/SURF4 family)